MPHSRRHPAPRRTTIHDRDDERRNRAAGLAIFLVVAALMWGFADGNHALFAAALVANVALNVLGWVLPWDRLPRWLELVPALLSVGAVWTMVDATGGLTGGFGIVAVPPMIWFAFYGSTRELLLACAVLTGLMTLPLLGISASGPAEDGYLAVVAVWALATIGLNLGFHELTVMLRRSDAVKSRFLATASHELRTPLTAISGFATTMDSLWDRMEDGDKRSYVRIIETQSDRLTRLVDDLLRLSRLENGKPVTGHHAADVRTTVLETLRELDERDVEVACPGGLVVGVEADRLRQMLVNYVTNARKYGAPPIRVDAAAHEGWVVIGVSDDGAGVEASFVRELFEPFTRARDLPSAEQGTGLGLSIVRRLAEAQGGSAWYEPNEPRGSRFLLRLPAAGDGLPRDSPAPLTPP